MVVVRVLEVAIIHVSHPCFQCLGVSLGKRAAIKRDLGAESLKFQITTNIKYWQVAKYKLLSNPNRYFQRNSEFWCEGFLQLLAISDKFPGRS